MTELALVCLGGALGSITRYLLGNRISQRSKSTYPLGTFCINVSGALLLGVVTGMGVSQSLMLLFATGFLGAYTTFSTFMNDGFQMLQNGLSRQSAVYVTFTMLLGLIGFASGFGLVRLIYR